MTSKPKKIQSTFAILDVMHGRVKLNKYFSPNTKRKPIRVLIEAEIDDVFGNDDGVSQEFTMDVKRVTIK